MQSPEDLRATKQIKAAARAVVVLQVGLRAGSQQLVGSIKMLSDPKDFSHPCIEAFLAEYPHDLLSGESRLYVSDDALAAADAKAAAIETKHRQNVLFECKRIYFHCSSLQRQAEASLSSEGSIDVLQENPSE